MNSKTENNLATLIAYLMVLVIVVLALLPLVLWVVVISVNTVFSAAYHFSYWQYVGLAIIILFAKTFLRSIFGRAK